VFTIEVAGRFGDHGLVGAAVIAAGEIVGLVMSCRVLGLGVEHAFMRHIIASLGDEQRPDAGDLVLSGEIVETPRNIPVRHIFRDHGFVRDTDGRWHLRLAGADRAVA
jgi:predicted enzyme involved in methoxymalonyl-ACP biosynthesis